ncbi:MAG: phosphoenolpyruvate--protein phosphotransferase [Bradymonadia bacterium]
MGVAPTLGLKGIAASPGFAIGRAYLLDRRRVAPPKRHVTPHEVDAELARLNEAVRESEAQLHEVKVKLGAAGHEHARILEAHELMLRDPMLIDGARQMIRDQLINAEWALKKTTKSVRELFSHISDEYFRERRADVDYVADRILRNLMGTSQTAVTEIGPGSVLVAHDLSPSDTALLQQTPVLGLVLDVGGMTSHTAIVARNHKLPAVVGLEHVSEVIGSGDIVIVDGSAGLVLVNPSLEELQRYQQLALRYNIGRAQLDRHASEPAITRDGLRVRVAGNIELHDETPIVLDSGAEGIGLYRTEFLYMNRETLPDEDEQYRHYREVVESCGPLGATLRTLDIGGDKLISQLRLAKEANPAMGLRALRLCLREEGLFRAQLRALLRASVHGSLRIMVPFVSGLAEVRKVKALVATYRAELETEGLVLERAPEIGIMVELPSAAAIADILSREVDFFAIGTNDLIQYALAIDRANEHVGYLYHPLHPAILRMLQFILRAGRDAGIRVSMCGEMAGDPFYTAILLGLGLEEFSMNAVSVPLVKQVIRSLDVEECRALTAEAMLLPDAVDIESLVSERLVRMLGSRISREVFDPETHRP